MNDTAGVHVPYIPAFGSGCASGEFHHPRSKSIENSSTCEAWHHFSEYINKTMTPEVFSDDSQELNNFTSSIKLLKEQLIKSWMKK